MKKIKKCLAPIIMGLLLGLATLFSLSINEIELGNVQAKDNVLLEQNIDTKASAETQTYNIFFDNQNIFDVGLRYDSVSDGFDIVANIEDKLAWYTIEGYKASVGLEGGEKYGIVIYVDGLNVNDTVTTNFGTATFTGEMGPMMRIAGTLDITSVSADLDISINSSVTDFKLSIYAMVSARMNNLGIDINHLMGPLTVNAGETIPAQLPYVPFENRRMFDGFYTLEGGNGDKWYNENGAGSAITYTATTDTMLYSNWTNYTVYIMANGGEFPESEYVSDYDDTKKLYSYIPNNGDTIGDLPIPTISTVRTNFKGWCKNSTGLTTGVTVNTTSSELLEEGYYYIAVWEQYVNVEVFVRNSSIENLGSCSASGEYVAGDILNLNYSAVTNYNADAWLKWAVDDNDNLIPIGSGKDYIKYEASNGNLIYTILEDDLQYKTIKFEALASYTLNIYSVTNFDINSIGGTVAGNTESDTSSITWTDSINVSNDEDGNIVLYAKQVVADREFNFIGWYLRTVPTETNYATSKLVSANDCTYVSDVDGDYYTYIFNPSSNSGGGSIYALFLEDEKNIYLLGNDGVFGTDDRLSDYGSYKMLTYTKGDRDTVGDLPIPTNPHSNATFTGWCVQDNSVIGSDLADNTEDSDILIEGKYYVAVWEITLTYSINIFVMNTAGNYPASASYNYTEDAVTGTSITFTSLKGKYGVEITGGIEYSHATFSSDGTSFVTATSGTIVSGSDIYTSNSVVRLYYKRLQHVLTLDAIGGTITVLDGWTILEDKATKTLYYEQNVGSLPSASKVGYVFKDWKLENSDVLTESTTMSASDVTATANFKVEYNSMIFDGFDTFDVQFSYTNNLVTGDVYATIQDNLSWYQLQNKKVSVGFVGSGEYAVIAYITGLNNGDSVTSNIGNAEFAGNSGEILRLNGWITVTDEDSVAITIDLTTSVTEVRIEVFALLQDNLIVSGLTLDDAMAPIKVARNGPILTSLPNIPTREHYMFEGYYTGTNGSGTKWYNADGSSTGIMYTYSTDTNLYSNWTPKTYSLTLTPSEDTSSEDIVALRMSATGCDVTNVNGVFTISHQYDVNEVSIVIASTLSRPVYIKIGDGEYNLLSYTYTWIPDNNATYIYTIPKMFNISLSNLGGVTGSTLSLNGVTQTSNSCWAKEGDEINLAVTTVKEGYNFKGWYTSENIEDSSLIDVNTPYSFIVASSISDDYMIYAYAGPNTYTVVYNSNGGNGTMSSVEHTYDVARALSSNMFTKEGYKFAGWSKTSTGDVEYLDCASVKNLTSVNGGEVILYAVWTELTDIEYTVYKYEMDTTGTFKSIGSDVLYAQELSEVKIVDVIPKLNKEETGKFKATHYYIGVGDASTIGTEIDESSSFTMPEMGGTIEITVYFTRLQHTITLNLDGGTYTNIDDWSVSGETLIKTLYYEEQVGTLPVVTKTKYIFNRWLLDDNTTTLTSSTQMGASDMTATAIWDEDLTRYIILDNQNNYDVALDYYFNEKGVHINVNNEDNLLDHNATGSTINANLVNGDYGVVIYVMGLNEGDIVRATFNSEIISTSFGANSILKITKDVVQNTSDSKVSVNVNIASTATNYSVLIYAMTASNMTANNLTLAQLTPPIKAFRDSLIPEQIPIPERENYTFKGYYTQENGAGTLWYKADGTRENITYTSESSINLYSHWELNKFNLCANRVGKTVDGEEVSNSVFKDWSGWTSEEGNYSSSTRLLKVLYIGDEYGSLPEIEAEGYRFVGWYDDLTAGTQVTSANIMGTQETNIYPRWEKIRTLTADGNGGTLFATEGWTLSAGNLSATKLLYHNDAYGLLPTAERKGYTFSGWFTESTGGVQVTAESTMPNEDTTIYAQWINNTYTIQYNDSNGNVTSIDASYLSTITLPTAPTRDGYTFVGWADNVFNDLDISADTNNSLVDNQIIQQYLLANTIYNVAYNFNVSQFTPLDTVPVFYAYNTSAWGSLNIAGSELYTDIYYPRMNLDGLTEAERLGISKTIYMSGQTVSTSDLASCSIAPNGVIYKMNTNPTLYQDTITLIPTTTNYFVMYTDADLYQASASYTINKASNTTLYAIWQPVTYTVTANANTGTFEDIGTWAGTSTEITNDNYIYTSYLGTVPTPTKLGYEFAGWYTDAVDGTEINYLIEITSNITIYAHWSAVNVSVEVTTATSFAEILTDDCTKTGEYPVGSEIYLNYTANKNFTTNQWTLYYLDSKGKIVKISIITSSSPSSTYIIKPEDSQYTLKFEANTTYYANVHAVTNFSNNNITGGSVNIAGALDTGPKSFGASVASESTSLDTVTLYAKPQSGYTFVGWYVRILPTRDNFQDGILLITANDCTWMLIEGVLAYGYNYNPQTTNYDGEMGGGDFYALFLPENIIRFDNELLDSWYTESSDSCNYGEEDGLRTINTTCNQSIITNCIEIEESDIKVAFWVKPNCVSDDLINGLVHLECDTWILDSLNIENNKWTFVEFEFKNYISGPLNFSTLIQVMDGTPESSITIKGLTIQEIPSNNLVGNNGSIKVAYGASVPNLTNVPTLEGYTFEGYYTEQNGQGTKWYDANGVALIDTYNIANDTRLYSNWIINTSTLTINPNGGEWNGSTSNSTITKTYGSEEAISNPTREGYDFAGWEYKYTTDTSNSGTVMYNQEFVGDSTNYDTLNYNYYDYNTSDGEYNSYGLNKIFINMWVYSKDWSNIVNSDLICNFLPEFEDAIGIIININGADITISRFSDYNVNLVNASSFNHNLSGAGWHMISVGYSGSALICYIDGNEIGYVDCSEEPMPQYISNIFYIGADGLNNQNYFTGKIKNVIITKSIYTAEQVLSLYNGVYTYIFEDKDVTLTANWTPKIYDITMDKQEGLGGTDVVYYQYNTYRTIDSINYYYYSSESCYANEAISSIEIPTREGYTFGGYYTQVNGAGTQVVTADGELLMSIYNTIGGATVYANWISKQVEVEVITATSYAETISSDSSNSGIYTLGDTLTLKFEGKINFTPYIWMITRYDSKSNVIYEDILTTINGIATYQINIEDVESSLVEFKALAQYNVNVNAYVDFNMLDTGEITNITSGAVSSNKINGIITWYGATTELVPANEKATLYAKVADGYIFEGWYLRVEPEIDTFKGNILLSPAGETITDSNGTYYIYEYTPNTTSAYDNQIGGGEFYALFLKKSNLTINNGEGISSSSVNGVEGTSFEAIYGYEYELSTQLSDGYSFKGWFDNAEGSGEAMSTDLTFNYVMTKQDVTIYPVTIKNNYVITLDYQGGTDNKLNHNSTAIDGTFESGIGDFTIKYDSGINELSTNSFNGQYSLHVIANSGDNCKLTYNTYGLVSGNTYTLRFKIMADTDTTLINHIMNASETQVTQISSNLLANTWMSINASFVAGTDEYSTINFVLDLGVNYYIDDIGIVVNDNTYVPPTTIDYNVSTPITKLPYAIREGYVFRGWNTSADGNGTYITTYQGSLLANVTYYAIYTLSNPTITITADKDTIKYGEEDSVLTATVNAGGLTVDITYQWYVSTSQNFTPSDTTKISGATLSTYTHTNSLKDVGKYYYKCVVTISKDGETSSAIVSNSQLVEVVPGATTLTISMTDYQYGQLITNPEVIENISGGQVTFYYNTTNSSEDGLLWSNVTSSTYLDVGTYYMYAIVEANGNYTSAISNIVEFKVIEGEINIEIKTNNNDELTKIYDGTELQVFINADVDTTIYIGTEENNYISYVVGKANNNTLIGGITQVGSKTIYYNVTSPNYKSVAGNVTISITPKSVEVVWETKDLYTYNGSNQANDVKAYYMIGETRIDCDIEFNKEFKDSGEYVATATTSDANYTLTNNTINLEILKLSVVITAEDKNITYGDGTVAYSYITSTAIYDDIEVTYTLKNGDVEIILSETTDAGIYTIVPRCNLSTNNYEITYANGTLTIDKYDLANATIASVEDVIYSGEAYTPTPSVTALGVELQAGVHYEYSYLNNINVGNATITITAKENTNYKGSNSITFKIICQTIEIPEVSGELVYDGTLKTAGIASSDLYTITNNTAIDAGNYTAIVSLVDKNNYTWTDASVTDKSIDWSIKKADTSVSVENSIITMRAGTTSTNIATVVYVGKLENTATVSTSGANDSVTIGVGNIVNKQSILTINANTSTLESQLITVTFSGDKNHNSSSTTFTIEVIAIVVELNIPTNGSVELKNYLKGLSSTRYEVLLNNEIYFIATPDTNYGLLNYSINNEKTYITDSSNLRDAYTSTTIKITEDILINNVLTINVEFAELSDITFEIVGDNGSSAIEFSVKLKAQEQTLAYTYLNNVLTSFKGNDLTYIVTANKIETQYYVVNSIITTIGESQTTKVVNLVQKSEQIEIQTATITISVCKVYNSSDKNVYDNAKKVATVVIVSQDQNALTQIDGENYIVEGTIVNYTITSVDTDYDFLGVKVDGELNVYNQSSATEWSYDEITKIYTWKNQQYTMAISNAEAVVLERWYTPGVTTDKTLTVNVGSGITAELINVEVGYKYTLSSSVFTTGENSLYAGTWKVRLVSGSANVSITVTTNGVTKSYSEGDEFEINSDTTVVVITIN